MATIQPNRRQCLERLSHGRTGLPLRTVFMGSAPLACASLETVMACTDVVAVVTQPDRPSGRHLRVTACSVKANALSRGLPVLTPANVNQPECVRALSALRPDVIVVAAYGQLLRAPLLALAPLGCVNVHTSLLPRYRGAAPIQWTLAHGEQETGVTTMFMDEGMDTGDIILRRVLPVRYDDTCATLHDRLAFAGGRLLAETLACVAAGKAPRTPQDSRAATRAPRLRKEDGRIDWSLSATAIRNRVRGFNPWPGTFTRSPRGERLKILAAAVEPGVAPVPGRVGVVDGAGPLVGCGSDALRLLEVQPAGGKIMSGHAYALGHRVAVGACMG